MAGDTLPYIDGTSERLVLGTAQLGMDYGIANRTGTPNPENAAAIIEAAIGGGIREFDTAQAYSRSEKILGRVLSSLGAENSVRIITKGLVEENPGTDGRFRDVVTKSLDNLGIRKLHAFMLHKERLLDKWDGGLGAWARALRDSGLIEHIGVSVYSPEKALQALAIEEITIVQIPSNALDRRFEKAGVFQEANSRKKRIYVRSIFLQGLLIMPLEDLPSQMAFAAPTLKVFRSFADSAGISRHQLALGYVRDAYPDARIIFGAETHEQIRINTAAWLTPLSNGMVQQIQERFKNIDSRVLNPALW